MTTEPNAIADTTKLDTIDGPHIKAAAATMSEEGRYSKRFLTPLTANPLPVVDDIYPKMMTDTSDKVGHDLKLIAPMTSFWRKISDQFVREHIHNADKNAPAVTPEPPAWKRNWKASRDETFTLNLDDPDGAFLANDGRFSRKSLINNDCNADDDDDDAEPYLDPDLVRRAHRIFRRGKPKNTPSEDNTKVRGAPKQVGAKNIQDGLLEVNPGKFVKVHGTEHAQEAIQKGKSTVAKCSACSRRYAVDESARKLYCTRCGSVTDIQK
jgi:hypothetical protein